jgi:hypothetical protein
MINSEKLQELLSKETQVCISLYMPAHPTGREQQQDPIRFKNLLSDICGDLEKSDFRNPEIEAMIKPAEALLQDRSFWQHQNQGLAVFIAEDVFEIYQLPQKFESLAVVAEHFYIKPLLPLISGNEKFYILALSQNDIRLLQGDRFSVTEVDLQTTPTSLKEALWFDDPERQLQFHTGTATPGSGSSRASVYHGHGLPDAGNKTDLLRFFQKVNQGLMDLLQDEKFPFVLAGVDYLLPIYQEANDYPHLVEDGITGNPEKLTLEEIHIAAWPLVKPIFQKELFESLNRYQALSGSESALAASQLDEIIQAAFYGRVDTLFVELGKQIWGTCDVKDAAQITVESHPEFMLGDQDLINLAAVQTIVNGGQVYALKPEQMPEKSIAAIFRFSYQD